MQFHGINLLAVITGIFLMMIALASSNITLARGSYAGVLITAVVFAFLAVLCLAVPFMRGPAGWRIVSVVLALPALYVAYDFLRRYPFGIG